MKISKILGTKHKKGMGLVRHNIFISVMRIEDASCERALMLKRFHYLSFCVPLSAQRKEEVAGIRAKFPTKVPVSNKTYFSPLSVIVFHLYHVKFISWSYLHHLRNRSALVTLKSCM